MYNVRVLCYGDSNTYGYDPRSYFGGRYSPDCRWTDLLAEKTGWMIQNMGMNGRRIPSAAISVPEDTDLLIIMLGTNDLLQGASVSEVTEKMARFLSQIAFDKILLIAPPSMKRGEWVGEDELVERSCGLIDAYQELALQKNILFAGTKDWEIDLAYDGVHFSEEGHKCFADKLYRLIMESAE